MRFTLVAALVLAAAPAHAAPDDLITRPLVLPHNGLDVRLTAGIDVQYQRTTQILSLAPDVWWGISPRWTLGLIHSAASLDRIDALATLCVRDPASSPCTRLYEGGGLDVKYGALDGPLSVAPRVRLLLRDTDPFKPAITLGAELRWTYGRFAIAGDPYVRLPLANHSLGNRAALFLPVWFEVQPARGWLAFLHTGYDATIAVLSDGSKIPFSLGVTARATCALDLGFEAGWDALLGAQHDAKHGTVLLTAGWHR